MPSECQGSYARYSICVRPDSAFCSVDKQTFCLTRKEPMPTLADVAAMLKQQPYAVVSTIRPSGTVQSTLVNAGLNARPAWA